MALNWKLKLPTPTTHPDFPLWAQGYTSEQVYDIFFPKDFRFICNPDRPAVCGRFGPAEERLWRFEYVVLSGEDGHEMASSKNLKKVIYPYLTHPGSRYGYDKSTPMPFHRFPHADNETAYHMTCRTPRIASRFSAPAPLRSQHAAAIDGPRVESSCAVTLPMFSRHVSLKGANSS